jgi:hypothetical protein
MYTGFDKIDMRHVVLCQVIVCALAEVQKAIAGTT